MPLSEHEQRLLEQMERALYAEDPKFASTLRSGGSRAGSRGRLVLGVVAFLAGVGVLMAGAVTSLPALGIVGFVVMLVGAVVVYMGMRPGPATTDGATGGAPDAAAAARPAPAAKSRRSGFMERLEDRWRRRRESGGM